MDLIKLIFILSLQFTQEELVYLASFGFIDAGEIKLDLKRDSLNYIRCEQETKGLFSLVYRVKDWYESTSDSNFVTKRFEKSVREGPYSAYQLVSFKNGYATYQDGDSVSTIQNAKDIISIIYWLRLQELIPGDTLIVPLHTDKWNYEIKVCVESDTLDGKPCILVIPDLHGIRAFGTQSGLMLYYNELKIPVLLKIKFAWGYIQARLTHREWR
ncbi:MAG: DUF3108 domain-containing protein [bacterium]|nr:DUF3108 domain-containing protein [bacterium]